MFGLALRLPRPSGFIMSPPSASRPARKYGSLAERAVEDQSRPPACNTAGGEQQRRRPRWRGLAAIIVGAAVMCYAYSRRTLAATPPSGGSGEVAVFPKVISSSPKGPAAQAQPATDEIAPLSFSALNFYHVRDGKPGQDYPWLRGVKLIEPYRETTLSVLSPRDGFDYQWEIHGTNVDNSEEQKLYASATGAEVVVTLTVLDENMVTLREVNSFGKTIRQLDEVVMVKYVRREIRTLSGEEREELMDAVSASLCGDCRWACSAESSPAVSVTNN